MPKYVLLDTNLFLKKFLLKSKTFSTVPNKSIECIVGILNVFMIYLETSNYFFQEIIIFNEF